MRIPKSAKKSYSIGDEKSIKKYANIEEKKIAKSMKKTLTPSSGATPFLKGDIKDNRYLIDVKSTKFSSITITDEMLHVVEQQANMNAKIPLLILNFSKKMKCKNKQWICIPKDDFEFEMEK